IYVKKGVYLKALAQLEPAVEELGKNPAVLYHLGAAYAGKGDVRKAVAALEKALGIAKEFSGSDDAKKLLEKLKTGAKKSG
ncbi:MAG: hypothetical protein HY900_33320, partial [Deltaproteobacteria bacterium]|nr:hypothetical protein [Deltaproteobacteria bacterium]